MLEGMNESGGRMRLSGRRVAAGKPLIAASEMLESRIGILDEKKGLVIHDDSEAGRAIAKMVAKLKKKGALEDGRRLHQERGACNSHMKLPEDKARELEALHVHTVESELAARAAGAGQAGPRAPSAPGGRRPVLP